MICSLLLSITLLSDPSRLPENDINPAFAVPKGSPDYAAIYLKEMEKYLHEDPDDGRFGMSRMPAIHGKSTYGTPTIVDAFNILKPKFWLAGMTYGQLSKDQPRYSTISSHYGFDEIPWDASSDSIREAFDLTDQYHAEVAKATQALVKSEKATGSKEINYGKVPAMVRMRAIYPPRKACLSCHSDVKEGQPIGVAVLALALKK